MAGKRKSIKQLRRKRKRVVARRKFLFRHFQSTRSAEKKRSLLQRFRTRKEQAKRLARRIKRRRRGVPRWLPDEYVSLWRRPWTDAAANNARFRSILWRHGYASPNFPELETRCKDNTRVPPHLIAGCQRQAFRLEKVRHELGDRPMPALSWYRHAAYNRLIGGASQSRHIQADATDFDVATVSRLGRARFDAAMEKWYRNDGFGTYPSGSRHGDVRGYRSRWSSF